MAVKARDVFKRLIERNPDVDKEELIDAFRKQARDDPALLESLLDRYFNYFYPIVKKMAYGEPLNPTERAVMKVCDGKHVTKAEQALVDAYVASSDKCCVIR
jgi:hypothetical protein